MNWKKYTAVAIAAGASLFFSVIAPVSATPMGQATAAMSGIAAQVADSDVIEVRDHGRRGGYGRHRGYGRHGGYGRGWYGRHAYRRHRRHNGLGYALPLLAVPLIIESQRQDHGYEHEDGGDDEGLACYRRCREENDADYCRYNHRDYC